MELSPQPYRLDHQPCHLDAKPWRMDPIQKVFQSDLDEFTESVAKVQVGLVYRRRFALTVWAECRARLALYYTRVVFHSHRTTCLQALCIIASGHLLYAEV